MSSDLPILLVGGGGHCRSVIDVIEREGLFRIAGVIDNSSRVGEFLDGYPYIGTDEDLPSLSHSIPNAVVTVGQIKSSAARQRLYRFLTSFGYELPVIVSPTAEVSKRAVIGQGTVVMHHVLINAGVEIGHNCIINSGAIIEHDCRIGDHCHISVNSVLCGQVIIKNGCFIGAGAICREGIMISNDSIIGMGEILKKGNC